MAVGTLPILLIGLGIKLFWAQGYEQSPLRSVPSIAIVSIVMALLLALAERNGVRRKNLSDVSGRDGLVVGLAQALALIPGVSRSGSTLTAALFDGWQRADAARFSFLLGIPAITIAGLVELRMLWPRPLALPPAVACRNRFSGGGVVAGDRLVVEVPAATALDLCGLPAAVWDAAAGLVGVYGAHRKQMRPACGMSHPPGLQSQLWIQPAVAANRSRRWWRQLRRDRLGRAGFRAG